MLSKHRHSELLISSILYKSIWGHFELLEEYIKPFISLDELYPHCDFFDMINISDVNLHRQSRFYGRVTGHLHFLEEKISNRLLVFHNNNSDLNEVESKKIIHKLNSIINKFEPQLPEDKSGTSFYGRILKSVKASQDDNVLPLIWNMTLADFSTAVALNCRKYYKNLIKSLEDNLILNPVFVESNLTNVIIKSSKRIQGLSKAIKKDEKLRTAVLANFIDNFFIAKDESSWGKSETGKSIGEPDIKIESTSGEVISICEGINIDSIQTDRIARHLNKIFSYDTNGVAYNYFIVFNDATNFSDSWSKYLEFVSENIDFKFELKKIVDISDEFEAATINIKVGLSTHIRENLETKIYHIFLNMKD